MSYIDGLEQNCVENVTYTMAAEFSSIQLSAAVLVLFLTWALLSLWKRNRNLPPGPWSIPFLGYYHMLTPSVYLDFARLAQKYGNLFSFRSAGGTLFVVLNGSKLIKDILINRSEEFIGRPLESNLLEWISDGLGVTQEEGPAWKEHRRYFLKTVKNYGFGKLEIEAAIQKEIHILKRDLKKSNGQPVNVTYHIKYAVSSVITQIMFALKFDKYGDIFPKLAEAVHDLIAIFANNRFMLVGLPFRLALYLFPWGIAVRRGQTFLKTLVQGIIDNHVRDLDVEHPLDYVDSYLCQMEELKKNGQLERSTFTMERLLGISMNMTMEGTESSGDTICHFLIEASKHPEEQAKVQKELDKVVGRERLPSWTDRQNLPQLNAFIQELSRIAQAFLITTHYCNFEETTIQGYRIPKRSIIVGNLWTINNDPRTFPNPKKFDTGRFLDENGQKIKTDGPYPFSIGKRDCVGQSLAQVEVFLIVASMLQSFTLQYSGQNDMLRVIPRN